MKELIHKEALLDSILDVCSKFIRLRMTLVKDQFHKMQDKFHIDWVQFPNW